MFNVQIRPLKIEDAKISYHWRNDKDIWVFTKSKPNKVITEEIETNWIIKAINEIDSKRFAILANHKYIGNLQLTNIKKNLSAEYHIFIGEKEYWGKGISQIATHQILEYAKKELKLKSIYLYVNPAHKAAIKLYENCGFIKITKEILMVNDLISI